MSFKSKFLSKGAAGAVVVGASMALAPIKAEAATLDITDAGSTFDLLADDYQFQNTFADGTAGATLSFTFENTSSSLARVVLSSATINQQAGSFFAGGASVDWANAGNVTTAAQGTGSFGETSFVLGAGASDTLNLTYGDVTAPSVLPDVDFTVTSAPVPLPAGGLLLLTALGGLGGAAGLRRRRKAA